MIEAKALVIIPKGTLTNRILVMVSAIVFAKHLCMDVKMIWDCPVPYDVLFLNNIDLVDISYFHGKHYQYNPNGDQSLIYNQMVFNSESQMHIVIESTDELKHKDMSDSDYLLMRNDVYLNMLRENMNGMLLGQVNLIAEVPNEHYCITNGGEHSTRLKQVRIDEDMFDFKNEELRSYTRILIYSRATVLVNIKKEMCEEFVEASKISMVPVVNVEHGLRYEYFIPNSCENLLGYGLVINPDMKRISLL